MPFNTHFRVCVFLIIEDPYCDCEMQNSLPEHTSSLGFEWCSCCLYRIMSCLHIFFYSCYDPLRFPHKNDDLYPILFCRYSCLIYVTRSLVLYVSFVDRCLSFCPFLVFGHCVVCPVSIYGFWLPLWYLQIRS